VLLEIRIDTGAGVGGVLALKWEDISDAELVFWETKTGRTRRLPVSPDIRRFSGQPDPQHVALAVHERADASRWQKMGRMRKRGAGKKLVDGRRLELPTSALRTRRSPN
jgi:hypothetical protein